MNGKRYLFGTLITCFLAGCGPQQQSKPSGADATRNAQAGALPEKTVPCEDTSTDTCDPDNGTCTIQVKLEGTSKIVVKPSTLKVTKYNKKVDIVWKLDPAGGAVFDHTGPDKDGVFFKQKDDEFEKTSSSGKGNEHKRKFKNKVMYDYKYWVRLRTNDTIYKCDPTINNEGAT